MSDGRERMGMHKNSKGSEELRRKREEAMVELRRKKKDEQLSKRRQIQTGADEVDSLQSDEISNGAEAAQVTVNEATLHKIVEDMFNDSPERQFIGTQTARKILSRERHPPIDVVIGANIVPRCIEFLNNPDHPELQFEAAWVLTNIASGTSQQTEIVVKAGAVTPFIQMLRSPHPHIAEQAIWALGNIAGDGPQLRDYVIAQGIVAPLVTLSKTSNSPSFLRNVAWTLSNLCRAKNPPPPPDATRECLPALAHLISLEDMEVVADACWALSYLSDGSNDKIEEVIRTGAVSRLVKLLDSPNYSVVTPCLRAVGNIVTGNDSQTQAVLKAGVLPYLKKLLVSHKPNIVKEAAWTISNISAGTLEQITVVIEADIVPLLVNVLKHGDFRSQKEAIWALTNITSGGSVEHMIHLCNHGLVPAYCDLLNMRDWKTIIVVLDGLENILKAANEVGQVDKLACAIEECGGLDKIEQLQSHENNTVYNKAYTIIDNFFSDEQDDEENADILPEVNKEEFVLNVAKGTSEPYNF